MFRTNAIKYSNMGPCPTSITSKYTYLVPTGGILYWSSCNSLDCLLPSHSRAVQPQQIERQDPNPACTQEEPPHALTSHGAAACCEPGCELAGRMRLNLPVAFSAPNLVLYFLQQKSGQLHCASAQGLPGWQFIFGATIPLSQDDIDTFKKPIPY